MAPADNYEYDVFVSYPHAYPFEPWVKEIFIPLFEAYLQNELNRPASIFYDRSEIHGGDVWPEKLRRALVYSRCLVGIWAPAYFFSHWCAAETGVMMYRAKALGYGSFDKPQGLVLPIVVFDGENFPDYAKRYQPLDCRKYFRVGKGFVSTERYIDLQDALIQWVPHVAQAVRNAPPWKQEWREDEWLKKPLSLFPPIATPAPRPVQLW